MFYFQRKSCESAWTSRNVNTIHLANNKFSTHFPSKSGFNSTRKAFWQHPSNLKWNLKIQKTWWFVEGITSLNMSLFKVQISFGKCTFLAGGWTTQLKKYARHIGSSPQVRLKTKGMKPPTSLSCWKHRHLNRPNWRPFSFPFGAFKRQFYWALSLLFVLRSLYSLLFASNYAKTQGIWGWAKNQALCFRRSFTGNPCGNVWKLSWKSICS